MGPAPSGHADGLWAILAFKALPLTLIVQPSLRTLFWEVRCVPSAKQNVKIGNLQVAVELTLNAVLKDVYSLSSSRILRCGPWHHPGDSDGCTCQGRLSRAGGLCPAPGKVWWAREVAAHLAGSERPPRCMLMEGRAVVKRSNSKEPDFLDLECSLTSWGLKSTKL